ncbi:MAG: 1-hydroxycarotenoid 3,4-desaturase CrtD [Pseudomonadota bacterium]
MARHWWPDGATLDLFADPAKSEEAVGGFAGRAAAQEFAAFSAEARQLFEAFEGPVMTAAAPRLGALTRHVMRRPGLIPAMAPHLTLAQGLARRFSDPRLRQLFGRYATYVGGSPYKAPAILSLIWRAESSGVWRVEGGMGRLAAAMARAAEAQGAAIIYGVEAAEIDIRGGAVAGVVTRDGQRRPAERVVFNGDPAALRRGLLGDAPRRAVSDAATTPRALSAYVWSFAAKPGGVALAHHTVFFGAAPRAEFDDLAAGRMPRDPTLYVCAQDRGAQTSPSGDERFEIIMNAPPTTPSARTAPEEERDACRTLTFETLARFGLTFAPAPETDRLTTPTDFARLFPASDGSLYGRSPHGLTATFQRPVARTSTTGLYLAGGGAHPGAGVPRAALSGRRAAEAIVKDHSSTSPSRRTATPGGMSTGSLTTDSARSPSSGSSGRSFRPGIAGQAGATPRTTAASTSRPMGPADAGR